MTLREQTRFMPVQVHADELTQQDVVTLVREQLGYEASGEEIWQTWLRLKHTGPTIEDSLGRVVADMEGIAIDG